MSSHLKSGLYLGHVVHERHRPKRHHLKYRVFALLLDLDERPALDECLRLFAHNRGSLLSFQDRDHGPGDGSELRHWVERQLAEAAVDIAGGPIRLLCYPRLLGYVFNPLTVYFCHHRDGPLRAILYEVSNTFGERHVYLIPVTGDGPVVTQSCDKVFYVSPFIAMNARYHFRVQPPGARAAIAIHETDDEGALLDASFSGRRRELSDWQILKAVLTHPLMTLKVTVGIHWEAFRLWRKGVPLFRRPPPPDSPVSIIHPTPHQGSEVRRHVQS